jgi:hypothetical protein
MRRLRWALLIAAVAGLGACGDRVQTIGTSNARHADTNAWEISSSDASIAPGWTVGDRASWDDHLRRRTQMQTDYAPR